MPYKDPEKRRAAARAASRRYYARHAESVRTRARERHVANRDERLAQMKTWRETHVDHVKRKDAVRWQAHKYAQWSEDEKARHVAAVKKWRHENAEHIKALRLRYRALKNGAGGTCTAEQLQARIDFYGGCCWMCGRPYEAIDHVIPLSKGGTNWPANLRPACTSCNSQKSNKNPNLLVRAA